MTITSQDGFGFDLDPAQADAIRLELNGPANVRPTPPGGWKIWQEALHGPDRLP